jgi:hypothetical protein
VHPRQLLVDSVGQLLEWRKPRRNGEILFWRAVISEFAHDPEVPLKTKFRASSRTRGGAGANAVWFLSAFWYMDCIAVSAPSDRDASRTALAKRKLRCRNLLGEMRIRWLVR